MTREEVEQLEGAELDLAVAQTEAANGEQFRSGARIVDGRCVLNPPTWVYNPSTNWAYAGTLLDKTEIGVGKMTDKWYAYKDNRILCAGPTRLVAVMRGYVLAHSATNGLQPSPLDATVQRDIAKARRAQYVRVIGNQLQVAADQLQSITKLLDELP